MFFELEVRILCLFLVCVCFLKKQKRIQIEREREREREDFVWNGGIRREEKGNIGDLAFFLVWSALNY